MNSMRALIDTHTLLWMSADEARLGSDALALTRDPANQLVTSIASFWEIAIKASLGRLKLDMPFAVFVQQVIGRFGIEVFPVALAHLVVLNQLPFHHRDPFDRILVAQAKADSLPLVSIDAKFDAYGIQRIW